MANYIDGFVFPLSSSHLEEYKNKAEKIAEIWKENGALAYFEYVGEDLRTDGTRTFIETVNLKEDEVVIFGWLVFESKAARDLANKSVPEDPRMADLIAPLIDPDRQIFDAGRMIYGGFKSLIESKQKLG